MLHLDEEGNPIVDETTELLKERGSFYGDPIENLGLYGNMLILAVEAYQKNPDRPHPSVLGSHSGELIKICRSLTGRRQIDDNFDDIKGYAMLGKECAQRTK